MLGVPADQLALSEDSRTALAILAVIQAELKDYIASLNDFERGRLLGRIYGEIVKEIAISGATIAVSSSAGPGGTAAGVASSAARILHKLGVAGRAGFVGRFLPKLSAGFPYTRAAQAAAKLDELIGTLGLSDEAANLFRRLREENPDLDDLRVLAETFREYRRVKGESVSLTEAWAAMAKVQGRAFADAAGDSRNLKTVRELNDPVGGFGGIVEDLFTEDHHIVPKSTLRQIYKILHNMEMPLGLEDEMPGLLLPVDTHRRFHALLKQEIAEVVSDPSRVVADGIQLVEQVTPQEYFQALRGAYSRIESETLNSSGLNFEFVSDAAFDSLRRTFRIEPTTATVIP